MNLVRQVKHEDYRLYQSVGWYTYLVPTIQLTTADVSAIKSQPVNMNQLIQQP